MVSLVSYMFKYRTQVRVLNQDAQYVTVTRVYVRVEGEGRSAKDRAEGWITPDATLAVSV